MSALTFILFSILLAAGCVASWKGAIYWHNRTRDARAEDPRDQEIRELNAALSIARKELSKTAEEKESRTTESDGLREKLQHAKDSLSDTQQKYNATKDTLTREIEKKDELNEDLIQIRRELEIAQSKVTELEIQLKTAVSGSNMIAGFDDVIDDDQAQLEAAEAEATALRDDVARWKQHCAVLSETHKSLRSQITTLEDQLAPQNTAS